MNQYRRYPPSLPPGWFVAVLCLLLVATVIIVSWRA